MSCMQEKPCPRTGYFMKPDSALLKDSKPFFIPDFCEQVDYETEMVVRICRLGKIFPNVLLIAITMP